MKVELVAKHDSGCTGMGFDHYTFGTTRSPIAGGVYIQKGQMLPDEISIIFNQQSQQTNKERRRDE